MDGLLITLELVWVVGSRGSGSLFLNKLQTTQESSTCVEIKFFFWSPPRIVWKQGSIVPQPAGCQGNTWTVKV